MANEIRWNGQIGGFQKGVTTAPIAQTLSKAVSEMSGRQRATKHARTIATVSQPRKNGPMVTKVVQVGGDPKALIWRLYNYLLDKTEGVNARVLARRFRTTKDAITATLRDLRKKGHTVLCQHTGSGNYIYKLA